MQKAEITDDGILKFDNGNEGFDKALKEGFFLLKIPDINLIEYSDKFANNWYLEKHNNDDVQINPYRGFKNIQLEGDIFQGYFNNNGVNQIEYLAIEKNNLIKSNLPLEVVKSFEQMNDLAVGVLKNVLRKVGIAECDWDKMTGGVTSNNGHHLFQINHHRKEHENSTIGNNWHRDFGLVSVLRTTDPGLIALIDDKLFAINPEEGYFIVNFGRAFEILTEKLSKPVNACAHCVIKIKYLTVDQQDRVSYIIFTNCNMNGGIYRYDNGKTELIQTVEEFFKQEYSYIL